MEKMSIISATGLFANRQNRLLSFKLNRYKDLKISFIFVMFFYLTFVSVPIAKSNAVGDFDRDLFRYIHEDMENGFLDIATENVQRMGDMRVYAGVCMFLCAFGDEKMFETGKLAAAAFMEAGFLTFALKEIVRRPRPLHESERNSFPSGHSAYAFTLATIGGYKYTKLRIPLYFGAFCTAFSRVYLGRHYPSDVLMGAVIGSLVGWQIIHFKEPILRFSF